MPNSSPMGSHLNSPSSLKQHSQDLRSRTQGCLGSSRTRSPSRMRVPYSASKELTHPPRPLQHGVVRGAIQLGRLRWQEFRHYQGTTIQLTISIWTPRALRSKIQFPLLCGTYPTKGSWQQEHGKAVCVFTKSCRTSRTSSATTSRSDGFTK